MTQIMKLLDLAPDIQEQLLFWPLIQGLNERNLRPIVRRFDWDEQRRIFQKMMGSSYPYQIRSTSLQHNHVRRKPTNLLPPFLILPPAASP